MALCSGVMLVLKWRISSNSSLNFCDEVDGGAGGRIVVTIVIESNNHVFTLPNNISMPGLLGFSWLYHGTSPLVIQSCSNWDWIARLPPAVPALSPLALVINFCATALPNASPASRSLRTLAPAINLAFLC